MYALILIAYWLLFWHKHFRNPYLLCTSEVASTFFPHWLWMGNELREGRFPAQDNIYYNLPGSIPFLSTFYPPSLLAAYIGSALELDSAFRLYAYFILAHFLLGSLFAYWLFGNLFSALTLTYAAYCIKPNTPCFVFSACWVPLALKGGLLGMIGLSMALCGGYFPILVYIVPVIAFLQPLSFLGGCFLALPQLLPFIGYFRKSIRMNAEPDVNFGKLPPFMLTGFFNPTRFMGTVNGVHYPEVMMYMGIAPFLIWKASWWWLGIAVAVLICIGLLPSVQRIPARALYLLTFSIASLASHVPDILVVLQGFLLIGNSSIYPSFPFAQWWDRPSKLYNKKPKSYNWPFLTGYLKGERISEYQGAFRLRSA